MNKIKPVIVEAKASKVIKGEVGLFAAKAIKKDEIIAEAKSYTDNQFITWDEYKTLDKLTKKKVFDFCCGREDGFFAPKDFNTITIGWYMNHSCDPNVGFDSKYNFVAIKSVKKGDELFWDYSYDDTNPKFKLNCICGTKKCRKTVTGDDWKNATGLKFHAEYLSPDVKKKIKQINKK